MIDVNHLKALTKEAIDNKTRKKDIEEANRREKALLRDKEQRAKSKKIIAKMQKKAEKAAMNGESSLEIMKVVYDRPTGAGESCNPEWLIGASKYVYEYCVNNNLNPTLVHGWDGDGRNSWFTLTINW